MSFKQGEDYYAMLRRARPRRRDKLNCEVWMKEPGEDEQIVARFMGEGDAYSYSLTVSDRLAKIYGDAS